MQGQIFQSVFTASCKEILREYILCKNLQPTSVLIIFQHLIMN